MYTAFTCRIHMKYFEEVIDPRNKGNYRLQEIPFKGQCFL